MHVSHNAFRNLTIILAVLTVALLPMWPFARWGYMPSGVALTGLLLMYGMRALARD